VILLDANLLVYAVGAGMRQHDVARTWLDARLNGPAPVGLPWPTLLAFIRLISNPRVFERPRAVVDAWGQVEEWLACAPVWIPAPTDRHREILGLLLGRSVTRSNLVADAHLAALAIEHGLTLCSTDGDFGRFPGLRWENPLATTP
jgi:toxin-antitoxin system PIN domain toxin